MATLTQHPSWQSLCQHQKLIAKQQMRDLFNADPKRYETFSTQYDDLLLDYSKHRITTETHGL